MQDYAQLISGPAVLTGNSWDSQGNQTAVYHQNYLLASKRFGSLAHSSYYGPKQEDVVHPFSFTKEERDDLQGSWHYTRTKSGVVRDVRLYQGYHALGTYRPSIPPSVIFDDTGAYNAALGKFYEKLRNSDLMLDIAAAEFQSTRAMIGKAIFTMRKFRRQLARLRKGIIKDLGKNASKAYRDRTFNNAYLEVTYGWKPLLSDLHNSLTHEYARNGLVPVVGTARKPSFATLSRSENLPEGMTGTSKCTITRSVRYKVGCEVVAVNPLQDLLSQLALMDPASLFYELTPYSFVLDWFWDLGGYLQLLAQARSKYPHLEIKNGYITKTTLETYETVTEASSCSDIYKTDWGYIGTATKSSKTLNRTLFTPSSMPTPKLPSLETPSLGQFYNGLVLLGQALARR